MSEQQAQIVRPYGDRAGDGMLQMSFTLEVEPGARAKEAALQLAEAHGLRDVLVVSMQRCGPLHTCFVVYGRSNHYVDLAAIEVSEAGIPDLDHEAIERLVEEKLGRPIVVVGACTGSDAHTVGIDAILNVKGYAGDKGLESYRCIEAHNLGAQVENESLLARALAVGADALLVSQVITQRRCHEENARALVDLLEQRAERDRMLLLLGGPRIDHKLALEVGFDAGFGPGTLPRHVAALLATLLVERAAGQVDRK